MNIGIKSGQKEISQWCNRVLEEIEFQTMSKMVGEVESLVAALHSSMLNTDRELQELGAEEEVLEAWLKMQQGIILYQICDQL